ncbi:MAG TPA: 2-aminoethylphosphonate ABC transporter substrate-binding protein [bacterium]|nr:2-aminoethylphosphonate ABC transporter substrate-binding protein [bacterium]
MSRRVRGLVLVAICALIAGGMLASTTMAGTAAGVVTLYTADGLDDYYAKVIPIFENQYGVKVNTFTAGTGAVANRLALEKDHPAADVAVQYPPFTQADAKQGLFAAYTPAEASALPAAQKDPQGRWYAFMGDVSSWIYNPSLVRQPPVTFSDLLRSELRGRVAYSNPATADDGQLVVQTLATVWDKDRAFNFLKQLEPSVKFHTQGTSYLDVLVSRGEVYVANGDLQMDLSDQINQSMNIRVVFLRADASSMPVAIAAPGTVSLVAGAPHQEAGQRLVAFLISKVAQQHVTDVYGIPVRSDVPATDARAKAVMNAMKGVRVLYLDWDTVSSNLKAWNAEWLKDVAQAYNKQTNVKKP